jgi:hypothetical protein
VGEDSGGGGTKQTTLRICNRDYMYFAKHKYLRMTMLKESFLTSKAEHKNKLSK